VKTLNTNKKYHSKLLLVGEYALLVGGDALSICYDTFYGVWQYGVHENPSLHPLLHYIRNHETLSKIILHTPFENELFKGLFFKSNIPEGYGLGSSGALCAAVLDQFSKAHFRELNEIKSILGMMESFFHGQSSGLDPLVSYMDKTLWVKHTGHVELIPNHIQLNAKKYSISLYDSGQSRHTELLVNVFKEKINSTSFRELYQQEIIQVNHHLIDALLNQYEDLVIQNWKQLSINSLEIYDAFIPTHVKKYWQQGLDNNDYYLKLCGAGGGGYFLCMKVKQGY